MNGEMDDERVVDVQVQHITYYSCQRAREQQIEIARPRATKKSQKYTTNENSQKEIIEKKGTTKLEANLRRRRIVALHPH